MAARLLTINRGRNSDVRLFSASRAADEGTTRALRDLLGPGIQFDRRWEVLNDPTNTYQFVHPWDSVLGMVTRPRTVDQGGTLLALGNFTDTIGEPLPVTIPQARFRSHFTTLVPRRDAEYFGLPTHPVSPDQVRGPTPTGPAAATRSNQAPEASLGRLNFPVPDEPQAEDLPAIVALPCALPLAPGDTFPHGMDLADPRNLRDDFRLLEAHRGGLRYALDHNNGRSATVAGPLLNLDDLNLEAGQDDPFDGLDIVTQAVADPAQLAPNHALYGQARTAFMEWSNSVWHEIGSSLAPEQPPPAGGGGGFTPADFREAIAPLVNKDKKFRLADRTAAKCRLLLAGRPDAAGTNPTMAVLPQLKDTFAAYLEQGVSATAADDLKELFKALLVVFHGSELAVNKGVTLEADNITLAVSDRIRTHGLLTEKLILTSSPAARVVLGLIHLLTPCTEELAAITESDKAAVALVMSNSSSSSAQLDATKASKMHTGGRCDTFQDVYTCALNVRAIFGLMVEDLGTPLVLVKMMEFAELLVTREGRLYFAANRQVPGLAIHPWQDLHTVWSAFASVGANSTLCAAVLAGNDVDVSNYAGAVAVADTLIQELRAILLGNGLGKYAGQPVCKNWFDKSSKGSSSPGGGRVAPAGGDPVPKKPKVIDGAELDRLKEFGVFTFDTSAAGSNKLPTINVFKKKNKSAKSPERLCMNFMTIGRACRKGPECNFPHVSNLASLSSGDRKKLLKFVEDSPGLSWAPGKAPPGAD